MYYTVQHGIKSFSVQNLHHVAHRVKDIAIWAAYIKTVMVVKSARDTVGLIVL